MNDTYKSIGLFIDGGYYAKINEALGEQSSLNINVTAFMNFIRRQVSLFSVNENLKILLKIASW